MSPRYLLKIDLQKAFDSIQWDVIKEYLTALKFPETFTKWILTCVTSVNFFISLNSQRSDKFKGGEGTKTTGPSLPLTLCVINRLSIKTVESCK